MHRSFGQAASGRGGRKRGPFQHRPRQPGARNRNNRDFECLHCGRPVSANPLFAGVQNRNHCPYCLWSRHVDSRQAGDRLAACMGAMEPVGLTAKRIKKKYGDRRGELMLVHRCVECGKLSINRIAADDDPEQVLEVFERSSQLEPETRTRLETDEIELLGPEDVQMVRTQLFGRSS